jgi:cellulose synthase/poly-beta-1,6-N-acetylglucosamine synthase-like glycosyltransferase
MFDLTALAILLSCGLLVWVLLPLPVDLAFVRTLRVNRSLALAQPPISELPKVTIILCLRGPDPFLSDCLAALFAQDYPNYRLHIVVDSPDDPAMTVVKRCLEQHHSSSIPFTVRSLRVKASTCSLKCSALLQAVSELEHDCEAIVLIDADTIAHPTWLREMVQPLADPQVGAATGNRWYMPKDTQWGSLFRYLWNSSAIIYMVNYQIPWGGSLAIKTQVLRQCGVLEQWAYAFVEDVPLYGALKAHGLRVHLVPSAIMVNQESCTISSFTRWRQRQELATWLYHPSYRSLISYSAVLVALLGLMYGGLALALVTHHWSIAGWLAGALSLNLIISLLLQRWIDWEVRQVLQSPVPSFSPGALAKLIVALVVAQLWGNAVLLVSAWVRRVEWRGITYQINSARQVQLIQYLPYHSPDQSIGSTVSL